MAFVAGPRNRQKYAPQVEGPVQPQPTNVIEAYQQGGIPGALSMIFNAPDPGIGPMAVVQKAGAAPLRPLLIKQAVQTLPKIGYDPKFIDSAKDFLTLARPRKQAMERAPMVQQTLKKIRKAATGKPISIVGHRAESMTGPVPGRGTFFSARPSGARPFNATSSLKKSPRETARAFEPIGKRIEPIQFKNPYVMEFGAGGQAELLTKLGTNKDLPVNFRKAALATARQAGGERWYTKADKVIAQGMKLLGHDGLIYKDTDEIIDFAGTLNIPKRGVSR